MKTDKHVFEKLLKTRMMQRLFLISFYVLCFIFFNYITLSLCKNIYTVSVLCIICSLPISFEKIYQVGLVKSIFTNLFCVFPQFLLSDILTKSAKQAFALSLLTKILYVFLNFYSLIFRKQAKNLRLFQVASKCTYTRYLALKGIC